MTDTSPMPVVIEVQDAHMIVTSLQLAIRHPGVSKTLKKRIEATARQLQAAIVGLHPEAEEILEMGWNTAFDVGR